MISLNKFIDTCRLPTAGNGGLVSPTTPAFLLSFYASSNQNQKRQGAPGFVGTSGSVTDSCTDAISYTLEDGQLFAVTSNSTEQFGTDPGLPYAPFAPSSTPGNITTTFTVDASGNLYWTNETFFNYQAQWCILMNQSILAVFQQDAGPSGCLYVQLSTDRCMCTLCFILELSDLSQ